MKEKFKLGIVIFACDKIDKYREQIRTLNQTWVKKANEYSDIKTLFFIGEQPTDEFKGDSYINLKGVNDDGCSVNNKQYEGIKYFYDNYDCDFIYCCGTDTYINIPKLYKYLDNFNPNEKLYIGGCGIYFNINNQSCYFLSGGSGFIITRGVTKELVSLINNNLINNWNYLCEINNCENLSYCCDVSIAYYLQKVIQGVSTIDIEQKVFYSSNYKDLNENEIKKSITCHFMPPNDILDYNKIMENNDYFLDDNQQINSTIINI
jgi:hypothetical protein